MLSSVSKYASQAASQLWTTLHRRCVARGDDSAPAAAAGLAAVSSPGEAWSLLDRIALLLLLLTLPSAQLPDTVKSDAAKPSTTRTAVLLALPSTHDDAAVLVLFPVFMRRSTLPPQKCASISRSSASQLVSVSCFPGNCACQLPPAGVAASDSTACHACVMQYVPPCQPRQLYTLRRKACSCLCSLGGMLSAGCCCCCLRLRGGAEPACRTEVHTNLLVRCYAEWCAQANLPGIHVFLLPACYAAATAATGSRPVLQQGRRATAALLLGVHGGRVMLLLLVLLVMVLHPGMPERLDMNEDQAPLPGHTIREVRETGFRQRGTGLHESRGMKSYTYCTSRQPADDWFWAILLLLTPRFCGVSLLCGCWGGVLRTNRECFYYQLL